MPVISGSPLPLDPELLSLFMVRRAGTLSKFLGEAPGLCIAVFADHLKPMRVH